MERRKFTREFKLEAVRLIKERGVSYAQASHDLSVHQSQLRSWVKAQADDPQHGGGASLIGAGAAGGSGRSGGAGELATALGAGGGGGGGLGGRGGNGASGLLRVYW